VPSLPVIIEITAHNSFSLLKLRLVLPPGSDSVVLPPEVDNGSICLASMKDFTLASMVLTPVALSMEVKDIAWGEEEGINESPAL
jgi:hypothetical protein